jgi:hypothetical protein
MTRPTRPPHDGIVQNPKNFSQALQDLQNTGPQNLTTQAGTPFLAQAHVAQGGNHPGQDCIKITNNGDHRAYVYECCWGHVTNCSGTYIDVYTPVL